MKKTLIVVPAYNEQATIQNTIDGFKGAHVPDIADILIVNDGSADRTEEIARGCGVMVVSHVFNMGYGAALQTGYKYAAREGYHYVIQIDADGQHDPCNIEALHNVIQGTDEVCDIVIGSRFLEGSRSFKVSWLKRVSILMFNSVIRLATRTSVTDPTSGLQALNYSAFSYYARMGNFVHDFPDANMVLQMLLNDFCIKEVPAVMHERVTGESMHSGLKPIKYMIKMALSIMVIILREKFKKRPK